MHHVIKPSRKAFCCLSLSTGVKIGIVIDNISLLLYVMTYFSVATAGVEFIVPNHKIAQNQHVLSWDSRIAFFFVLAFPTSLVLFKIFLGVRLWCCGRFR